MAGPAAGAGLLLLLRRHRPPAAAGLGVAGGALVGRERGGSAPAAWPAGRWADRGFGGGNGRCGAVLRPREADGERGGAAAGLNGAGRGSVPSRFDPPPAALALAEAWRKGVPIGALPEAAAPRSIVQGWRVAGAVLDGLERSASASRPTARPGRWWRRDRWPRPAPCRPGRRTAGTVPPWCWRGWPGRPGPSRRRSSAGLPAAGGPKSDSAEPRQRPPPAKNCRKRGDCRLTRAALTRDLGRKSRHARFAAAATEWGFV